MARAEGPNLDRLSSIEADGSRIHIQTADVKGRFVTRRRLVYGILIAIYVAMPFVQIGGHPALFLDIKNRQFWLFGSAFNAQDAWLIFFLLMTIGFGLLFFTAWLGRVWCGWACPQTVFLEGVYRRVERLFEGPREKRIRMAKGPMTPQIFWRKAGKHATYVLISLLLAHVFVAFFVSLKSLGRMVVSDPREHWIAFLWVMSVAALLYFNFAWFREQLCIVVCPYGRLQSAMQDDHSVVIGYDVARGEPRGKFTRAERAAQKAKKGEPTRYILPQAPAGAGDAASSGVGSAAGMSPVTARMASMGAAASSPAAGKLDVAASTSARAATDACTPLEALVASAAEAAAPAPRTKGDCIDCNRCVVVCPTGIDIRNGLQMECIGCAQCIDACDEVMDKIGRPRGLIRYDSLAGLAGQKRKVLRPRLTTYGAALLVAAVALLLGTTLGRNPFEANLIRVRGAPWVVDGANIRNQYELHLVNKNAQASEFQVAVGVPEGAEVVLPSSTVKLDALQSFRLPIFVTMERSDFHQPFEVQVQVKDELSSREKAVEARFLGPIGRK